jgi:chaperonin GroEL
VAHKQVLFRSAVREKILRGALDNAVSVASVLLLTEATMTEIPEKKEQRALTPERAR